MRIKRTAIAAALLAAAVTPLLGGVASAAPSIARFTARDFGSGPTQAAAEQDATQRIWGDYGPCYNVSVYAEGQASDGTWWARVVGSCSFDI